MTTETYIIVQDPLEVTGGGQPPGQVDSKALDSATAKIDGALVETADLTPREAMAVDNSPNMVAAPLMPTKLVLPQVLTGGDWSELTQNPSNLTAAGGGGGNWGIDAIGATGSAFDGSGCKIAVLDTGVDPNHAAFAGVTIDRKDFTGSGNGDGNGHGTHCAGTILGRDVGGIRIGVARGASDLLAGKVLDDQGSGSSEGLFKGMNWAIGEAADVISMSLGFDFPGMVDRLIAGGMPRKLAVSRGLVAYRQNLRAFDAIMATVKAMASLNAGAVVVAASGNESRGGSIPPYRLDASLPAASMDVLAVAAAEQADINGRHGIAPFSNGAAQFAAPGVDILSAKANTAQDLTIMSGTSMACPHVAGLAALWWHKLRQTAPTGMANAKHVIVQLSANAKHNVFAPNLGTFEFGDGLAKAP